MQNLKGGKGVICYLSKIIIECQDGKTTDITHIQTKSILTDKVCTVKLVQAPGKNSRNYIYVQNVDEFRDNKFPTILKNKFCFSSANMAWG